MQIRETFLELRRNISEIRRQQTLRKLRKWLRPFLIGFFIGRNAEKKIRELESRNASILAGIRIELEGIEERVRSIEQRIMEFANKAWLENIEERTSRLDEELKNTMTCLKNRVLEELSIRKQDVDSVVRQVENSGTYLTFKARQKCTDVIKFFEADLDYCIASNVMENDWLRTSKQKMATCLRKISEYNASFVEKEIQRLDLFDKVDGYSLTDEQRRAIAVDEFSTLVVAGAGTGKTTTLLGKAFYIVSKGLAAPEEVLLIAFNTDVVKENERRINSKPKIRFKVRTYHSFGLEIIGQSKGERPTVSPLWDPQRLNLGKKILEFIQKRMNEESFARLIIDYFLIHYLSYRSIFEFNYLGEYYHYLRESEVRSLKGELVKSFEECDIANFLYANGINYVYEEDYKLKTADAGHRQYRPDFYLPDYGIYIEHFGVDRSGKTAPWIPQNKYIEEMKWKESIHEQNRTTLVKTFTYERQEGRLLSNLQEKLLDKGVVLKPLPRNQLFEELNKMGKVNSLASLLSTFLNLYKSFGKGIERLKTEIRPDDERTKTFIAIFSAIYETYVEYLKHENHIDFNDMINEATSLVELGKYVSPFKYILVDEFQDISQSRYKFLKALLNQNNAKLFCVGDDWQSIYRFTGGDISIMTNFEKNFGSSETMLIQETHRFSSKMCDFSTKFMLQNPLQIRKKIISKREEDKPAVTVIKDNTENALEKIASEIERGSSGRSDPACPREKLWIINRYKDIGKPQNLKALAAHHPKIEIEYRTAHSSKGLETDYVVIIGLRNGVYGFPCQVEDDPVLNLVLARPESVKNAEERRLFYVAMTRARKHVYLVVDEPFNASVFVTEIESNGYEINTIGKKLRTFNCPVCLTGIITWEEKRRRYECSNSPYCDYVPRNCPKCLENHSEHGIGFLHPDNSYYRCSSDECAFQAKACPRCGDGYLVQRQDKYGRRFYGCSDFSTKGCRYTEGEFHKR